MTVYNELNKIAYIGNTSQTLYPIPFEYINTEDIKVSIYTSKNEFVEDWRYSTQYVIEGGNVKVLSGYAIDKNKKLLILRRVDLVQDNKYREGGDFPAKSTETSFDKLTMITQQLQETLDRCVKVEVLDIQTPDELLEEVYNKLDSATEVAEQAIGAANQATTAAKNANDAVVVAQQQITETQAFVNQARADINQTVEDSIEYVEQEAVKAATEVVGEVVGQYTDRAETAAKNAEADASRTAESANRASASATSAATSASEAEAIAGEVSVYNFKNKITNSITEIPQDIKLELNGGKLTLKAGSKVYVPNGVNRFDEIILNDNVTPQSNNSDRYFIFIKSNYNTNTMPVNYCYSGASAPTVTHTYAMWYDTTNNKIKWTGDNGSTWVEGFSLPLCIVLNDTPGTRNVSSIDQVFNGFGYIGSTVFALPGVKGLIPDGRNADGSLKNIEIVLDGVKIVNNPDANNALQYFMLESNGAFTRGNWYYEQTQAPSWVSNNNNIWYNPETNKMYYYRSSTNQYYRNFIFTGLTFRGSNGSTTISEFNQAKLPFRAVDQNDFNKLDEEVVKTSGSQTITGVKTFTSQIERTGTINSNGAYIYRMTDNNVGSLEHLTYYTGSSLINRMMTRNTKSGGKVCYLDVTTDDNGNGTLTFNGNTTTKLVNFTSATSVKTITPDSTSNDSSAATTAWVTSNGTKNSFKPNWAGKVSITRGTDYTAPSNGFIVFYASDWNKNTSIKINSTELFKFYGNVISGTMGCIPVCKGDVVNITGGGTGNNDIYCPTYFIPFK